MVTAKCNRNTGQMKQELVVYVIYYAILKILIRMVSRKNNNDKRK